jgi:hypothetical protein
MATPYPEPIDDEGNINVHADGAFPGAPFMIRENGAVIDASAIPLYFEIPSIGFRRVLSAHPTDAKARLIPALTKAECANVPMTGAPWVIFDETSGQAIDVFGARFNRYRS